MNMEDSAETTSNPISQGCGPNSQISVHISPTTGGDFYLSISADATVEGLKKLVSKKLKVPRDRICLLFRDKQLQDGSLIEHGVADGSKVTLLPNVETGLVTQRPEIGIMQALESLNDTQVNEFLCGKAPLNLSMRLGDHMMLIQLQLSTVSAAKPPPQTSASGIHSSRAPSLLQASRNLQHTLRRLSADVFSGRDEGRRGSVYSGTFSGALNPALQDQKGRPRRDVATIVHILNDLLCSAPELHRVSGSSSSSSGSNSRRSVSVSSGSSNNGGGNNNNNSGCVEETVPMMIPSEATGSGAIVGGGAVASSSTCNEDQNLRTRGKLEQLRLVMGERRERRRQRKQKPYSLPQQSDTDTVTA